MSLSARFQTSWQLMQSSLQVIRSNPRLLLFPVVSTLCSIALAIFFLLPVFALQGTVDWKAHNWEVVGSQMRAAFYLYGAVIYVCSMLIATFFNVGFYNEIIRAFAGNPVSLGGGLRFAASRWQAIVMWSLLAATVGLVIRAIEERLGWLGRIIMGLIGTAWSVAAVFAIPVIIRRPDSNPLAVLRDSAATLKRTWGESLIGYVGIQLAGVVFVLAALGFAAVAFLGVVAIKGFWVLGIAIATWLLVMVVASFVTNLANHVYRCALYVYASEGVVPGPFTAEMMSAAWKVKKG